MAKGENSSFMQSQGLVHLPNGSFAFHLSAGCPMLQVDNKCSVHLHKKRPAACQHFPVFVESDGVHLSKRCPRMLAGKLYSFEKRFLDKGVNLFKKKKKVNSFIQVFEVF
jgi:Fe-S-cluster containining protein